MPNLPHPMLKLPGGAIADFLPHLASTLHWLIGDHASARASWRRRWPGQHDFPDELRVAVEGERGTGTLVFSANARPETFQVRVLGSSLRATADLFESRVTVARGSGVPRPLLPFVNGLTDHETRLQLPSAVSPSA